VGQTGAGKSTLIKLLIQLKTVTEQLNAGCPVVGVSGREVPTSEDVHLYVDPATFFSTTPLLYADCEGLDGGEREPLATTFRNRREASEKDQTTWMEATMGQVSCRAYKALCSFQLLPPTSFHLFRRGYICAQKSKVAPNLTLLVSELIV
jgi:hypothetical protein